VFKSEPPDFPGSGMTALSTYDANGNTPSDAQGRSFNWDYENRLTQVVNPGVGTTTFRYGSSWCRAGRTSGCACRRDRLYDGSRSLAGCGKTSISTCRVPHVSPGAPHIARFAMCGFAYRY
jgi:hypothetical protein